MKSAFGLAVLAATTVAGLGHNNWDRPCFHGECAYDLPDHKGQSGTVKLFSKSPHAIADITPAAGWVVLDCDPNALSQEIRLVCKSDDAEGAGCNHFFEGGHGPVDKYVRLPESCSSTPFARITNHWVHDDQSVPTHHQVTRRDGSLPQVFAISIDDKFDEVDYSKYGDVNFVAYGISVPGIDTNFAIPDNIDEASVVDAFLEQAAKELMDASRPSSPRSRPGSGVKINKIDAYITSYYPSGKAEDKPSKIPYPAGDKKDESGKFGDENKAWGKFELKSEDLQCKLGLSKNTSLSGGFAVTGSIETFFWGKMKWGGVATGKSGVLDRLFGFFDGLEAHMRHEFTLNAALTGKFGWEVENPPWGIPGVTALEFGLAKLGLLGGIKLEASLSAEAALELSAKVQYGLDRAVLTIPPASGPKTNPGFSVAKPEFDASLAAAAKAKAALEIAATPKLILGASAGGSSTKTTVNGFVGFEIKLSAEVEASKTFAETKEIGSSSRPSSPKSGSRPGSPKSPRKSPRSVDGGTEVGFCVKLGFDAHAGAEAKFWGMGPSVKGSFWTYEFVVAKGGHMCEDKGKRSMITKRASSTALSPKTKSRVECPALPLSAAKKFIQQIADPKQWPVLAGTKFP